MKRSKLKVTILLLAAIPLFLGSCGGDKWPCINGSGAVITEMRTESGFTGVSSEIDATVYITQGSEFEVKLIAQQNVLDNIETIVSGGELEIKSDHCINNSEPVLVYITMPAISSLSMSGSGSMITQNKITSPSISFDISGSGSVNTVDSIITDILDLNISGSGDMDFIGKTNSVDADISGSGNITMYGSGTSLNFDISGSGELHAFYFPVSFADLTVSGSGNIETNVSTDMYVKISGSGNIFYKGTPAITAEISGSGELIHVD